MSNLISRFTIVVYLSLGINYFISSQNIYIDEGEKFELADDIGFKKMMKISDGYVAWEMMSRGQTRENVFKKYFPRLNVVFFDSKLNLVKRVPNPKKINNQRPYFQNLYLFKNKLCLFSQTLDKIGKNRVVKLWCSELDLDANEWKEPIEVSNRTGKWPYDRTLGSFKVFYQEDDDVYYILTKDVSYGSFSDTKLTILDLDHQEIEKIPLQDAQTNKNVIDTDFTDGSFYFLTNTPIASYERKTSIYVNGRRPKGDYFIYSFDGEVWKRFQIDLEGLLIKRLNIIKYNDQIGIFAFQKIESKPKDKVPLATVVINISISGENKITLINGDFLFSKGNSLIEKNDLLDIDFDDIRFKSIYLFENNFLLVTQDEYHAESGSIRTEYAGGYSQPIHEYRDLFVHSIDYEGVKISSTQIKKYQHNVKFGNETKHKIIEKDEQTFLIFYNDIEGNFNGNQQPDEVETFGRWDLNNSGLRILLLDKFGRVKNLGLIKKYKDKNDFFAGTDDVYKFGDDYILLSMSNKSNQKNQAKLIKVTFKD